MYHRSLSRLQSSVTRRVQVACGINHSQRSAMQQCARQLCNSWMVAAAVLHEPMPQRHQFFSLTDTAASASAILLQCHQCTGGLDGQ